jgi:hypothetical protein
MERTNAVYGEKAESKQVVHINHWAPLSVNKISLKVTLNRDDMLVRYTI